TVKNSSGTVLAGGVLSWTSSATNVATIDSAGIATGVAPGSTQITAAAEGVTSTAVTLTVTANVATVTISAPSNSVAVGSTLQFSATAKDSSGNVIQNAVFQWASNASSIATIDNNGLVTGVSHGTVIITASSGGVLSAPFMLTVQ
ncbi:MAG TPA: Ig-like domain-containing protein, partial [Terriglobales bacterium]|nr:Ig-like domain-containing protein [Terriglobales bacterium]